MVDRFGGAVVRESRRRGVVRWGLLAAMLLAGAARSASLPLEAAAKLDSRLLEAIATAGADSLPVWVEFHDKGEDGAASLAMRLDEARASLSPRALARRRRAHVSPLVDYRDVPVWTPYLESLAARGFRPYGVSRWFNHAAVRIPAARLAEIAGLGFVRRLEPVERGTPMRDLPAGSLAPATPLSPWDTRAQGATINYGQTLPELAQLNLPALHTLGFTGAGVLVCVLDDGFNYYTQHEATMNQVIAPGRVRDFVDGDWIVENTAAPSPYLQHGTWTFATAGGYAPGRFVGAGYGAQFALGRTENDPTEHVVEMVNWSMGAEWADSLGADVISSSVGYNTFDPPDPSYTYADLNGHTTIVTRAAEIAASKGILVVNSAGNEGTNSWHYILAPADVDGDSLIAVGAVNLSGTLASSSSRGPTSDGRIKPDLCADGVGNPLPNVTSPLNPTAYTIQSGTSFSAPLIAGLVACLLQSRPNASPVQIIQALRATASRAGSPDNDFGYGIPDALAAFNFLGAVVGVPVSPFSIRLSGPNPLRAGQSVALELASGATSAREGVVRVLDAQGRAVRHLWTGALPAVRSPMAVWDGKNDDGRYLNPGLYFASLQSASARASVRVVFLR